MTLTRFLSTYSLREFRCVWKHLTPVAIVYEIIAFVLLTPLVGLQFRIGLAASGNSVLTDQDILFFFLGPAGWFCLITVGTLSLGVAAVKQTALMAILAASRDQHMGLIAALHFARANAWIVVRLTARIVTRTLLTIVPFLAVAAATYFTLLTEYDINFYLQETPPEFLAALGIGGLIVVALTALLLRLFSGWALALPLLLFENVEPVDALVLSKQRTMGHRRTILLSILVWAVVAMALSTLGSAIVVGLGRVVVPGAVGSLELLSLAIGVTLLCWAIVMFTVKLFSTTMLSLVVFNIYQRLGGTSVESAKLAVAATAERHAGFRFSLKTCVMVSVLGFVAAAVIGVFAIQGVRLEDKVEVTADRRKLRLRIRLPR